MRRFSAMFAGAVVFLVAVPGGATPVAQTIVMNGGSAGHGLGISGTFSAAPPMCPSGRFEDGTGTPVGDRIRVPRIASCDDDSGTVTFEYFGVRENTDGPGSWRVLSATGRLAEFRGFGTTSNDSIEHDPTTGSGRFVNTWTGRSDLDSTPPTARIDAATARALGRRAVVRVGFRAADDQPTNPVAFSLVVWIRELRTATRAGELRSGRGAVALSVRNPRRAPTLRLELAVRDPLRNERTITRVVRIR